MRNLRALIPLLLTLLTSTATAQYNVTYEQAKNLYQYTSKRRVCVHDPSIAYNSSNQRYYIYGSHKDGAWTTDLQNWTEYDVKWKTSSSTNASNASAFVTQAVTKVYKGGSQVTLPSFNAVDWSARYDSSYDINGNMWAPDIIWNPTMNKWCYYLSINGNDWHSSIILLTADNINGPFTYQGPVVICGFYDSNHSYKNTDLELVIGTQSSLPSRYNVGSNWGNRWPHTIDPCVFYDANGKLWMAYGSWSGGIWMLELDESTGLRDYNVNYPSVNGSSNAVTSDPYYGTKVAGGVYVSGEGPYIERIGNYYYLFMSYGFYSPEGGYEMRVFRSENPNGPYVDTSGTSAIFSSYVMNYGKNGDKRGEKILGAYNNWGYMTVGECAQGHNSVLAANDGRTYLVYHTKFNNNTVYHEVRVHQLFINQYGWPVAAPFEYNGETITDTQIANSQPFTTEEVAGTYQLLLHKYGMDYANFEEVTPVTVTLKADGNVTGSLTGTWAITPGTGYINLTLGGTDYSGVVFEEVMDTQNMHTVSISACSAAGVNIWAYKLHPKYAVAQHLNSQVEPITDGQTVSSNLDLAALDLGMDNVSISWTSSNPSVISNEGVYNPFGLTEDTSVTLTARVYSATYYWEKTFTVTALSESSVLPTDDWKSGMVAHYGFDGEPLVNTFNNDEVAQLLANGSTAAPTLATADDNIRNGQQVHLSFGINGSESYVSAPNPLKGQTLAEGATISFWLKRTDDNLWDGLFGFVNGNARLYMTGNSYIGYNDGNSSGTNNWIDINHPSTITTGNFGTGTWKLVTLSVARNGITLYVDGTAKAFSACNGSLNGQSISNAANFDYNLFVDHLTASSEFYLGRGSFWGSADTQFDDLIIYNRPLTAAEAQALWQIESRGFDFSTLADEEEVIAQTRVTLDAIRAMLAVPHYEVMEGADSKLETTLDAIEEKLSSNLCTYISGLELEAVKAALTFLDEATPFDIEQPFDVTFLLQNTGMDSTEGWSDSPTVNFSCAEYYQQTFDFY